jgi:type VI secretion system protein ImpK
MREEIAELVHPILSYALQLRRRLLIGEKPTLQAEQAHLLNLLLNDTEAHKVPLYGGDVVDQMSPLSKDEVKNQFLGIRYALVCWLDETFVLSSPWSSQWNEAKLEVRLYSSNDRAWRFWEQARIATDRRQSDAVEVFFQCVMLGFVGELIDSPEKLAEWVAQTRNQLLVAGQTSWKPTVGADLQTNVPPLNGRQAVRTMMFVALSVVLLLVPVVAFLIARRVG